MKKHLPVSLLQKIVFVLTVVVVVGIAYYFYSQNNAPQDEQMIHANAEEELRGLAEHIGVTAELRDNNYVNWQTEDGEILPLQSKQIILGTSGVNGLGKYGDISSDDLSEINTDFLLPLSEKIKSYYISQGFVENVKNASTAPNDLWAITLAFEKDDLYCVNNLAVQSDPFGYLSCGTVDNRQLALQNEFSDLRDTLSKQEGEGNVPIIFRVNTVDGDYANGNISSLGGYQWIAQKTDGSWQMIWSGQDFPLCSDMQEHDVPTTMYPGCYNPETQEVTESSDYMQN